MHGMEAKLTGRTGVTRETKNGIGDRREGTAWALL
jgi:hypothetical protein